MNNSGATAPNTGISFANNTFKAVDTTTDTSTFAKALVIDGIDAGINPTFMGNWIESNDISLAINDSDGGNVSDVTLTGNTLAKSLDGAARPYTGIRAGYWIDQIHNVQLFDTQTAQGATTAITWSGSGTKDIEVGSLVTLTAEDSTGAVISGASVLVTDPNGVVVFSGVTDANGQVVDSLITTEYTQSGADPTAITTQTFGPFSVTAISGIQSATAIVDPTVTTSLVLNLA